MRPTSAATSAVVAGAEVTAPPHRVLLYDRETGGLLTRQSAVVG